MRICLVSEFFLPLLGGIPEHVNQFASHCLRVGHDVTLLTSNCGPIDPALIHPKLKIHRIGKSVSIFSNDAFARVSLGLWIGKKVKDFFKKNSFDIIHAHPPLTPTLPTLAARYRTAPIIGTVHTYFDTMSQFKLFQKGCQKILDSHSGFIAVSEPCVDAMRKYFRFNADIIPNGVDPSYFANGKRYTRYDDDVYTILFLGRLDPRNGLKTLFESFNILKKRGVKARLIIAGDGVRKGRYQRMIPSEYKDCVHFVGSVLKERPDYFASADTFCYPAEKASFGITLLEAMSAGVPVVASDINGFREVVTQNKEGLLVKEGDPNAFADAFEKLASDKNLRLRFGEEGRRRADEFSWDKISEKILKFYDKVLARKA